VRYATSKLANLYLAYELARRSDPRKLTVNAFDPGLMPETGLDREYPALVRAAYQGASPLLVRLLPGAQSVARSSADLAWLATSPDVENTTGTYFSGRRARSSSPESHDRQRAQQLWTVSEELVGLAAGP
jgi:protochlorophyllide reductase